MSDPLDAVRNQYERWIYPAPFEDLTKVNFGQPGMHYLDLAQLYWAYWPTAEWRDDLDILVAGCGSVAAACYAFLYPQARVLGIDLSAASLAHEEKLKQKHRLDNLTLQQWPIEQVAQLQRDFDLIMCQGVLHHTPKPEVGLRVLRDVLRPEGVIALMLYGKYGRIGVMMLQELFRMLHVEQDEAGVQVVRDALTAMGPNHPVQNYLRLAKDDLSSPTGLVDTFLHKLDRPFTVTECLDLVQNSGLVFQGWDENIFYHPDAFLPPTNPFRRKIEELQGPALWQAMELLYGYMPGHFFYACRDDRPRSHYEVPLLEASILDWIPVTRLDHATQAQLVQGRITAIARHPYPEIRLTEPQARVFQQMDNHKTLRQCLSEAGFNVADPRCVDFVHGFFPSLWRLGYIHFRRVGIH